MTPLDLSGQSGIDLSTRLVVPGVTQATLSSSPRDDTSVPDAFCLPRGSIVRELFEHPWKFDFFEAVLLLQQFTGQNKAGPSAPVGKFFRTSQESLRFAVPYSQAFPGSTIESIQWNAEQRRPVVHVNFMGLTGPSGTLPRTYSERMQRIELVARHAERNALRDWLDNFNHRMISLFFEAWCKYRFPIAMRRQLAEVDVRKPQPLLMGVALRSIAGLAPTPTERGEVAEIQLGLESPARSSLHRDELLGLAGMLAQRPMNVANLQAAAERCLGVSIHIEQFQGTWLHLEPETQTRLGVDACQLGEDALLGERIWSRQQKIRVDVGPLSPSEIQRFLPPTPDRPADGYQRLSELIRVAVGPSLDFDIHPILKVESPRNLQISAEASMVRLGIDSWLGTPEAWETATDACFAGGA